MSRVIWGRSAPDSINIATPSNDHAPSSTTVGEEIFGSIFEWLIVAFTVDDLAVQVGQSGDEQFVVLRDRSRPAVAVSDCFVEFAVKCFQIDVRSLVHRAVQLREPDTVFQANGRSAGEHLSAGFYDVKHRGGTPNPRPDGGQPDRGVMARCLGCETCLT